MKLPVFTHPAKHKKWNILFLSVSLHKRIEQLHTKAKNRDPQLVCTMNYVGILKLSTFQKSWLPRHLNVTVINCWPFAGLVIWQWYMKWKV